MSVTRYERIDFAETELARPQKTADGYWKLEGKIARSGIQEYRRADGTMVRELRMAEDVKASATKFALLPLTNGHPPGMVTPENAKQYTIGAVGHADFADGWVKAPVTVWSKDGIESIKAGRAQLSVGYQCTLIEEPGEWNGERYDCRQVDIVPNHLAIVDVARAGPAARLRLDSNSAATVDLISMETKPMHKFAVDGLTIEVSDANHQAIVERAIAKHAERADAAEKALAEEKKARVADIARADMADAKAKDAESKLAAEVASKSDGFKALLALNAEVSKMGVDTTKCDHTEVGFKTAAIKKLKPSINVDGKGAEYIAAVYDIAKDEFNAQPSAVAQARAGVNDAAPRNDGPSSTADEARRKYNERLFGQAK